MAIAISRQLTSLCLAVSIVSVANHFGLVSVMLNAITNAFSSQPVQASGNNVDPNPIAESQSAGAINGIQQAKKYAQDRKEQARLAAKPFTKEVNSLFVLGRYNAYIGLTAINADTVFIVRDKITNDIRLVAQVPKGESVKVEAPVGQYKIQYAQNADSQNATWQGLDKFWGYGTSFSESTYQHDIAIKFSENGSYGISGTGLVVGTDNGEKPIHLSEKDFTRPI
ncbi:hypothetical protein [Acinetobacter sp. P1(2025)]|uniref:hypothetical protein n=1 Tax=Acinetobacter sp. P1(2025) TaxID=3446120 RepID=UPI003F52F12D